MGGQIPPKSAPSPGKLRFSVFGPGPEFLQVRKTIPDSVFFLDFGAPAALRTRKGPEELLLVACCLLDAPVPPWFPNNLINRLKFYELQLGEYPTPLPREGPKGCSLGTPLF